MAENAELAFVKSHVNTIGNIPVQFPDNYQQPPEHWAKKPTAVPLDLPDPPERKTAEDASSLGSIALTFKSVKPPVTFTLPAINIAESISAVKSQLALQPGAPPVDGQRLLLRGKILVDNKLLKEYGLKDGDVINLMLKPGFNWDWKATPKLDTQMSGSGSGFGGGGSGSGTMSASESQVHLVQPVPRRHGRTPSIVLSPSPAPSGGGGAKEAEVRDIDLTLDASEIHTAEDYKVPDAFQRKIADPAFWEHLYSFLKSEFSSEADVARAFEAFLLGGKGELTASDVAKIRDSVGIVGMAGT